MSRTAVAILSTENLLHNLRTIKKTAPSSKIIAMVKANAYGHGLRSVSSRLAKQVDMLGVACIDEAIALRKVNVQIPILLAEGVFEPNELLLAATEGFHVVFHEEAQIKWLEKLSLPVPINAWLKINTGMGRLGFSLDEAHRFYKRLSDNRHVAQPVPLMSHFACADDKEHPLNKVQIDTFRGFIKDYPAQYSFANSAALFHFPDTTYDYVRPGIALYGASPIAGMTPEALNLKPVMTLQTSIIAIHHMPKGSSLGYGARYTCPEDMHVGVIAFGYGDGYPLSAKDGTPVLVNNVRCPLAGRISMDMMTVDLRQCPHAQVGDPVILWGQDLSVNEIAEYTGQSVYSILTNVQNRVKFLWTRSVESHSETV